MSQLPIFIVTATTSCGVSAQLFADRQSTVIRSLSTEDYYQAGLVNERISNPNQKEYSGIDKKNLLDRIRAMTADRTAAGSTATVDLWMYRLLLHLLKMVCNPLYPSMNSWMHQIRQARKQMIGRAPPKETLQEMWTRVTKTECGVKAHPVWSDSRQTIHFSNVPDVCPLKLDQVLQEECYPRKAHYGPNFACEGQAPNEFQKKRIESAASRNETLDDYWFHEEVTGVKFCED